MHFPSQSPSGDRFPSVPNHAQGGITVLVADPHCCVREGLKALVNAQPGMRVVGEACDGPTALARAAELSPDVVILDVNLPELDGAQVTARLREDRPDPKVLVLTACEQAGAVRLLLGMGARGYVLKRAAAEQLMQALRAVAEGGTYLDPVMAGAVVGAFVSPESAVKPDAELSTREVQVLRALALGYGNKEIAAQLKVSVKTVETYKSRAMEKLHLRSRVDIVRFATRNGWLDDVGQRVPAGGGSLAVAGKWGEASTGLS